MPAVLTEENICSTRVPRRWKPIIERLSSFVQLELDVCKGRPERPTAEDEQRLRELHDELVIESADLLEPSAIENQPTELDAEIFARAVFVLMKLETSIAADQDSVLDTAGSDTLHSFEADFRASPDKCAKMRRALQSMPGMSQHLLGRVEEQVEADAIDANRKLSVVKAIRDEFGLWKSDPSLRENIFRFFDTCYPDTGITVDEVELIVTGSMIFFCLPFSDTDLQTERFQAANEDEQAPVRKFLGRVKRFSQWQFAHFPVFGFLKGEDLPDEILSRLAARSELSIPIVSREIGRLTAIVPLQQVDKYVVHDVWGHGWQASLLRYDGLYEQLARYAQPLSLDEPTRIPSGDRIQLGDCFEGRGENLRLNETTFRSFVQSKIVERLPVAMTPVLAEVIADIAEFKYTELRPDNPEALLSSSLLKIFPSKLDLIVQDVPFYFRQATKAFRLWANLEKRQHETADQLIAAGASPTAARREVDRAIAIWQELEATTYEPQLRADVDGDELKINIMTRLALNFLGLHRAKLHAYQWIREKCVGNLPLKSFRDLLLISAAVYFEADPPRNIWRVDEFVTLRIEPLCEQLARGLDN